MNKHRLSRRYPKHAVGIDDPVREVRDLLEWGSEKKVAGVILYGIRGIGKTTLADAVFSAVKFDGCRYSMVQLCDNVDSTPKIIELQKMILQDLTGSNDIPDIRKEEDGQRELGRILEKVSALIYIDNVLDEHKLRQLLPLSEELNNAKKVRLLVTACDLNVGRACPMKAAPKRYCMTGISYNASMNVLKNKMLDNNDMGDKLNSKQQNDIIESCGGIPLMLTLVAQELHHAKSKQEVCKVIKEVENLEGEEFRQKLESCFFAYDRLPKECKEPFLNICYICSFLGGWEWNRVADIVGESQLSMLERRTFVTKGTNGVVSVPNVILKMTRKMSEKMGCTFTTTSQLEQFLNEKDEKVQQLKYLSYKPTEDLNRLKTMPPNLNYMEIDGKLYSDGLERYPAQLLNLPYLQTLKLINFEGLQGLPIELADLLKGLRELSLSNCKALKELPYSISKLEFLRVLRMDHCVCVEEFPCGLGNLTSLVELDLSYCASLRQLPEDFGLLKSLQILNFNNCKSLQELPHSFGRLLSLRKLNLSSCKELKNLPDALGDLTSLVQLNVSDCLQLNSIPESIGKLKGLPSMNFSDCSNLSRLPDEFCQLSITHLNLKRCVKLEKLPDQFDRFASLRVLILKSCESLKKLPESCNELKLLVILDLSNCSRLEELCANFSYLSSLRILSLKGCESLKVLPEDFHRLASLQCLDLNNCPMLEGNWMDNVAERETFQMMFIANSAKLVEKWGKIQRTSLLFKVNTGQDMPEEERERAEDVARKIRLPPQTWKGKSIQYKESSSRHGRTCHVRSSS